MKTLTPDEWLETEGRGLLDIVHDQTKGAAALLQDVLDWLTEHPEALSIDRSDITVRILARARPAMASFAILADRLEKAWRVNPERDPRELIDDLKRELREADEEVARQWRSLLEPLAPAEVLTLSFSSTVIKAIQRSADLIRHLHILESNPGGEGTSLADALEGTCPLTLHPDDALPEIAGRVDAGLVGADTVFADGSVLNKVLTRSLAEHLAEHGKPLFVVTTSWKQSEKWYTEDMVDPETSFESVPEELVTRVITELSGE